MRHVRDATCSYPPRTTIHTTSDNTATLALRLNRMTTPTLLSPSQKRRSIDHEDQDELSRSTPEFQLNGSLNSPSSCHLAGLGIHYQLNSSNILKISEQNHSSGAYDEGRSASYIMAEDVSSTSRHSTPAGTVFQLIDHLAQSFTHFSNS